MRWPTRSSAKPIGKTEGEELSVKTRIHRAGVRGDCEARTQNFLLPTDHRPEGLAVVVNRSYQLWLLTKARFSPTERQRLFGLTIAIGGVCGLVAVAFHQSIRWVEGQTIERAFAAPGDTWIGWVILVPCARRAGLRCDALLRPGRARQRFPR